MAYLEGYQPMSPEPEGFGRGPKVPLDNSGLDLGGVQYALLYQVLRAALWQASEGKGAERHAGEGEPFEKQIICEVAKPDRAGIGYVIGQAVKKGYEARRMLRRARDLVGPAGHDADDPAAEATVLFRSARQDLLGAINYLAAAYIVAPEYLPFVVDPDGGGR